MGAPILVLALLVPALLAPPPPRPAGDWGDPSPHTAHFVAVEKEVRLEVLDWGGSGRPLVLLPGGGNTAHVFDDLAPKLTPVSHVYAITRRGFGASGFSPSANAVDRLRDDVLAVIDGLELERPVLAGHSIAGAELSAVAASAPPPCRRRFAPFSAR
jgi:non-heme chloroperoxidase